MRRGDLRRGVRTPVSFIAHSDHPGSAYCSRACRPPAVRKRTGSASARRLQMHFGRGDCIQWFAPQQRSTAAGQVKPRSSIRCGCAVFVLGRAGKRKSPVASGTFQCRHGSGSARSGRSSSRSRAGWTPLGERSGATWRCAGIRQQAGACRGKCVFDDVALDGARVFQGSAIVAARAAFQPHLSTTKKRRLGKATAA